MDWESVLNKYTHNEDIYLTDTIDRFTLDKFIRSYNDNFYMYDSEIIGILQSAFIDGYKFIKVDNKYMLYKRLSVFYVVIELIYVNDDFVLNVNLGIGDNNHIKGKKYDRSVAIPYDQFSDVTNVLLNYFDSYVENANDIWYDALFKSLCKEIDYINTHCDIDIEYNEHPHHHILYMNVDIHASQSVYKRLNSIFELILNFKTNNVSILVESEPNIKNLSKRIVVSLKNTLNIDIDKNKGE